MVGLPSVLVSLSMMTFFLSSALRLDPRSVMYACKSSSFMLLLDSSCQRTSARTRCESLVSSPLWAQRNKARSAPSYFLSNGICPDFFSFDVTSVLCNCSFWNAMPEQPKMRRVASSVHFPSGHMFINSWTFFVYSMVSSLAESMASPNIAWFKHVFPLPWILAAWACWLRYQCE